MNKILAGGAKVCFDMQRQQFQAALYMMHINYRPIYLTECSQAF